MERKSKAAKTELVGTWYVRLMNMRKLNPVKYEMKSLL